MLRFFLERQKLKTLVNVFKTLTRSSVGKCPQDAFLKKIVFFLQTPLFWLFALKGKWIILFNTIKVFKANCDLFIHF